MPVSIAKLSCKCHSCCPYHTVLSGEKVLVGTVSIAMMSSSWLPLTLWALLSTLASNPVVAVKSAMMQKDAVDASNPTKNSTDVSWIFPSSSSTSTFNSVDTVNTSWSSTYGNPNLRLLCKTQAQIKFFQSTFLTKKPCVEANNVSRKQCQCRAHRLQGGPHECYTKR